MVIYLLIHESVFFISPFQKSKYEVPFSFPLFTLFFRPLLYVLLRISHLPSACPNFVEYRQYLRRRQSAAETCLHRLTNHESANIIKERRNINLYEGVITLPGILMDLRFPNDCVSSFPSSILYFSRQKDRKSIARIH